MKKKMITLGTVAIATSLFTRDNKADAIVNDNYTGKSLVKETSKNGTQISDDRVYWDTIEKLESQFNNALKLLEEYQYGEVEYKDARDKLMTRIISENQYLLDKKSKEYDRYSAAFKKFKDQNPNNPIKKISFRGYDIKDLRKDEYNDIRASLETAVKEFHTDVSEVQSKHKDLQSFDKNSKNTATDAVYSLVSEIDTLVSTYYNDPNYRENARELSTKLDLILGDIKNPYQITNERIKKDMIDDLNSIIDDFFVDTNQNRPASITKFDQDKHQGENNKDNLEKLVRETKEAVKNADESWKSKTVKKYDVKDNGSKTEERQDLVIKEPTKPSIPTYTEKIITKPMPSIKQEPKEKIIYNTPQRFAGLSGERNDFSTSYNSVQTRTTTNSNLVEFEEDTSTRSQYGPRPTFNKAPKYIKHKDASTGIHEYNDGTFGYEARPRFNKPVSTNKYNVTTKQDGTVSYGPRTTFNKPSHTNTYNVTTYADGAATYGPRATK
ncbi:TPA: staphylocoagulase [Staphylococcus aureus]|nr:staphylocoagulase [Staphylococcus aureus]